MSNSIYCTTNGKEEICVDFKKLLRLFEDCLSAEYRHVEEDGSFSVKRENDKVTVFFEKSNGMEDWRNNFAFSARPYRDMNEVWLCHRGFMKVFRAILPYLEPIFSDDSVKSFCLVGYSHGAALALLSHEYILFHRPELAGKVEGYGFGCPRVIAGHIPASLRSRLEGFTVIRNFDDIVTHLPPRIFGYSHVARPVTVGKRGRYSMFAAHFDTSYTRELLLATAAQEKKEDDCDTGRNGSCACRK